MTSTGNRTPVFYFPHGGGPLPLLGDEGHVNMVDFLSRIPPRLGHPASILVVSAHWEEDQPTITSGEFPPLIYDYFGFPEESYRITYRAPGYPPLAEQVHSLLKKGGIESILDPRRGFDHGLFVPLKILFPEATIPCVQLSLVSGLDPGLHIRIGRALSPLRKEGVLILGSGFSFHNLRAFFSPGDAVDDPRNGAFQDWLLETCTDVRMPTENREERLTQWTKAPNARYCHPREEHLLPLHVCFGAADRGASECAFDGTVLGKRAIALLWGEDR